MKIGTVIVTYNRLNLLKKLLQSLDEQTYSPTYILIVNNASTDGTNQFLSEWQKQQTNYEKYVFTMNTNTGGSGGFAKGMSEALTKDADWIWISDDDGIPESDALEQANNFLESYPNPERLSAICGTIINNGKLDTSYRGRISKGLLRVKFNYTQAEEFEQEYFSIDFFSYVATLINKDKLQQAGVTIKEYFIWYDDAEHSLRLNKTGKILCVPAIRVHHDIGNRVNEFTWKDYYGIRNRLDMYQRHFPKRYAVMYSLNKRYQALKEKYINDNPIRAKLIKQALKDAKEKNFGLNSIYKPGWNPGKN